MTNVLFKTISYFSDERYLTLIYFVNVDEHFHNFLATCFILSSVLLELYKHMLLAYFYIFRCLNSVFFVRIGGYDGDKGSTDF